MASTSSTLNISPRSRNTRLGLLARPHLLGERLVARDDLAHALLDRREVLRGERLVAEEVVVEAVLDHRPDGDLGAGPQRLHRLGQHMGGVVADQLERARIVAVDELDPGVAVDRVGEIGERAVERHRDGALGKRRRDRFGDCRGRSTLWDIRGARRPGKVEDGDHAAISSPLLTRCLRTQVSAFREGVFSGIAGGRKWVLGGTSERIPPRLRGGWPSEARSGGAPASTSSVPVSPTPALPETGEGEDAADTALAGLHFCHPAW